jgi:site-specific recombinase XerD
MSNDTSSSSPRSELERELERYIRYVTLERGRSPHTVSAYRSDLGGYLAWLAKRSLGRAAELGPEHVRDYIGQLPGTRTTVARKLSSIKNFHRFLLDEGVVVEMSDSDDDNFTKNLITLRAERRLALATEKPAAVRGGDLTPA